MRILFSAIALLLLSMQPIWAAVRVVTTTPDLAAIARTIGGAEVEVAAIARGDQDPHHIRAKPSYARLLNRADLLIYTGLELEVGWLPLLIQGGRNPRVAPGGPGHLDASNAIDALEVPQGEVDRSMGDVHPQGNPHYMLNPRNGLAVAALIAERLQTLDPEHAALYNANLQSFAKEMVTHIALWEKRLAALRGHQFVAYHKQWEYLTNWLGLGIVDYIEDRAGVPPSPRHIAQLIANIPTAGVEAIIYANYNNPEHARQIADRTHVPTISLPISVGGEKDIKTYADLFETIVKRFEETLVTGAN